MLIHDAFLTEKIVRTLAGSDALVLIALALTVLVLIALMLTVLVLTVLMATIVAAQVFSHLRLFLKKQT